MKQQRGAKTEEDHRGEECIIHLATYTYSSQPSNRHLGVLRMKIGVCGARVCMCVCVCVCMCAVTGLACHACWRLHTQEMECIAAATFERQYCTLVISYFYGKINEC